MWEQIWAHNRRRDEKEREDGDEEKYHCERGLSFHLLIDSLKALKKKEEEGKSTTMIEIMMKWTSPVRINIDSRQFCFPLLTLFSFFLT